MSAKKGKPVKKGKAEKAEAVGEVKQVHLENFVEAAMLDYGSHVVENRAIPDFRDGLKPVHRAILWSMFKLGLHYNTPYRKAARTVGDVIGKFHPHGDQSVYDAMVTIANVLPNLVDGFGNWGRHDSEAGAMRYTEARLSEFSDKFLLDPIYLSVIPRVPNFSNDEEWPVFLPAKLPVVLLTGTVRAPAFGVSIGIPSFKIAGVLKAVRKVLNGEEVTAKWLAKNLEFNAKYGGELVSSAKDVAQVIKDGRGSIWFKPTMNYDRAKREVHIESCSPVFASESAIEKKMIKLREIPGVKSVNDESGLGKIRYTVQLGRIDDIEIQPIIDKMEKELTGALQFNTGYTKRKSDGTAKFDEVNIITLLEMWCEYRVKLEYNVVRKLIKDNEQKLLRQEQLEFAVNHLEDIFQALRQKDPDSYLIKKWKKPAEFVAEILDLKVRRLAKLELKDIHAKQKEIKSVIKSLKGDAKAPAERVLRGLADVDTYIAKTKDCL